ncbi:MAG: hypothetical protein A2X17_02365 [Bacteroidetes bacterium GWF2_41_61]|nr:MAG: hypothetical protein A2X17_02365 [Bacteroidetes bacterium GWF2_41_61]
MKRSRNPIRLTLGIIATWVLIFTGSSCSKNEIFYEDASGILTFRYQIPDGRVFDCVVDQQNLTISNSMDSLLFGTANTVLQKIKPVFTTTIGAKVYVNGQEVKSGETEIDLTKPLKIETKYNSAARDYNVTAFVEKKDHSATSGAKINTDMRLTGLPSFNSYSAAYFKDKLYILGAYYPNGTATTGTAYYELYSSEDGGKWTKVSTNPNVLGGFGAELLVYNDKMYAIGGARLWGNDVNGAIRESSVAWRIMSTTNGTDWTDHTPGQVNAPTGRMFPQVTVHNGKIVLRRGKMFGFGMLQNVNHTDTYQTTDGTNWTRIAAAPITGTSRNEDAMFSFNNKLYVAGGYVNWISEANLRGDIWSSSDNGLTWQQESAASGTDLVRFGHRVVSYGGKLYMIGGEKLVGTARIGLTDVLSSTNGVNWTSLPANLQLPVAFTARIYPNVVMGKDDLIWIIGGFSNSMGNYTINGLGMTARYDVWTKRLK